MLRRIEIAGYRSIRTLGLDLGPLTVVLGANGAGKTNLYRSIELIHAAALGRLAPEVAAEGGMASAVWAGSGWRDEAERETAARGRGRGPVRISLKAEVADGAFAGSYALSIGLPNGVSDPALPLDPVVREEEVRARLGGRDVAVMSRNGPGLALRGASGRMETAEADLMMAETALGRSAEALGQPEVRRLARRLGAWRFHHHFRTDPASPLRAPVPAATTPALAADGADWAAVLYTRLVLESGLGSRQDDVARSAITAAVEAAFPGSALGFDCDGGRIAARLAMPGFHRPFGAAELSDGTLRYLCLVAALAPLRPPPLVVLNEPETSLNAALIPALAALIGGAAGRSQVLVVTHSAALAERLDLDFAARVLPLEKVRGETRLAERGTGEGDR